MFKIGFIFQSHEETAFDEKVHVSTAGYVVVSDLCWSAMYSKVFCAGQLYAVQITPPSIAGGVYATLSFYFI